MAGVGRRADAPLKNPLAKLLAVRCKNYYKLIVYENKS
jgi:hypothetical protein